MKPDVLEEQSIAQAPKLVQDRRKSAQEAGLPLLLFAGRRARSHLDEEQNVDRHLL